jgi:hypothetical protein
MIWLDISNLEDKISKNELSDKDGFNYVLAYFILSALTMNIGSRNSNEWIDLLNCFLSVLIAIWGLSAAYKANNEIDGKDFFKRFFAINWVIGMRMLLAVLILGMVAGIVVGIISIISSDAYIHEGLSKDLFRAISMSLFEVIYYLLIRNSIRRLRPC